MILKITAFADFGQFWTHWSWLEYKIGTTVVCHSQYISRCEAIHKSQDSRDAGRWDEYVIPTRFLEIPFPESRPEQYPKYFITNLVHTTSFVSKLYSQYMVSKCIQIWHSDIVPCSQCWCWIHEFKPHTGCHNSRSDHRQQNIMMYHWYNSWKSNLCVTYCNMF